MTGETGSGSVGGMPDRNIRIPGPCPGAVRRLAWGMAMVVILGMGGPGGAGLAARAAGWKVACVGDSITEGSGLSSPTTESYPAKLQRLVGTNHIVRNYGVSGRTLLKKGDYPYWKEGAYTQSRAWGPDVVVIKLGSNDAKPYNWRYGTNFVADYEELVGSYRSLPSQPRIIVCTPAPVFGRGAFDIQPGTVATNIAPAIRDLAARLGVELLDFQERLQGGSVWFPDTVHPNSKGTSVMAAMAFEALGFVQSPGEPPPPELLIAPISSRRVRLEWPAALGAWVVEARTAVGSTGVVSTVVEQAAYSDGLRLRVTNSAGTGNRFYRLWRP